MAQVVTKCLQKSLASDSSKVSPVRIYITRFGRITWAPKDICYWTSTSHHSTTAKNTSCSATNPQKQEGNGWECLLVAALSWTTSHWLQPGSERALVLLHWKHVGASATSLPLLPPTPAGSLRPVSTKLSSSDFSQRLPHTFSLMLTGIYL